MSNLFDSYTIPKLINKCGVPKNYSCLQFFPSKNIVCIGTNHGLVELYDGESRKIRYSIELPESPSVIQIIFLQKCDKIIVITNLIIYLIEYNSTGLNISDVISFKNERINFSYLMDDVFLYVGTIKGNVYIVHFKDNTMHLMPYAIFWNISCKGFAALHPGAVIFIGSCADRQKLYIVFYNGIISTFSLNTKQPINVSNAYEKIYSCTRIEENKIVMGCDNSAILFFDFKSLTFSRQNFPTQYQSIGSVWKVSSPYEISLKTTELVIACAGGLCTEPVDNGHGLSIFIGSNHISLSLDLFIDFSFSINSNDEICLITLSSDNITAFTISLEKNKPSFKMSNYLPESPLPAHISCIYSIISTSLQLNIHDELKSLWEKQKLEYFPNEEHDIKSNSLPFLLIFVGHVNGTIKLYLCDNILFFPMLNILSNSDSTSVTSMELISNTNILISYHFSCHVHINSLDIVAGTASQIITINITSMETIRFTPTLTEPPVELPPTAEIDSTIEIVPHPTRLSLNCSAIIQSPSDFITQGVINYIFTTKQLLFYLNDCVYILDLEKGTVGNKLQINLINQEVVKDKGLFSKCKFIRLYNPEHKIKHLKEIYSKTYYINDAVYHKISIQKEIMNSLLISLSCGTVISLVFNDKGEIHSCDTIYYSSSGPIIKILSFDEKNNEISNWDFCDVSPDSTPSTIKRVILVDKCSIHDYTFESKFQKMGKVTPLPADSNFTPNINIINDCLICLNSSNHLNIFDLGNLKDVYLIKLSMNIIKNMDLKNPITIPRDSNFLQLVVVSSDSEISWFSLDKHQIKNYKRPLLIDDIKSKISNNKIVKYIFDYITDKSSGLESTFTNAKDILVNAVAESSTKTMKSEILINAEERSKKLAKVAMESEKLALHAASFKATASQILEKAKRGEL